ncbi:MAG: hypothetical protein ACOH1H_03835 [Brevundimonas sp.]|jgi:hypothetical protein
MTADALFTLMIPLAVALVLGLVLFGARLDAAGPGSNGAWP